MTAVSFSISRGATGFKQTDVTVGTSAPGTGDVEIRYQVLDTNSKNMNDLDLILAAKAFIRWFETNGPQVQITNQPSGPTS